MVQVMQYSVIRYEFSYPQQYGRISLLIFVTCVGYILYIIHTMTYSHFEQPVISSIEVCV